MGHQQHILTGSVCLPPQRSRNLQCQRIFQVNAPINCVCLHPNQVRGSRRAGHPGAMEAGILPYLTFPALQAELIVGDQSGAIHIWDLKTDHNEQLIPEPEVSITSAHIDPDASYMAAVNSTVSPGVGAVGETSSLISLNLYRSAYSPDVPRAPPPPPQSCSPLLDSSSNPATKVKLMSVIACCSPLSRFHLLNFLSLSLSAHHFWLQVFLVSSPLWLPSFLSDLPSLQSILFLPPEHFLIVPA